MAAIRKAGGEADGALRRGREAAMQRADEIAIGRRAVVIDLPGRAAIGDGQRAPIAKADQAGVDDVLAVGARRHVDGSDIGPELPPGFPGIVAPDDRGGPSGIDQRHAMVRIAPEEALAVLQVIQVIGRRGRGRRGIGHVGRLAGFRRLGYFNSMQERLPPIHDLVRFWYHTKDATLGACVQFRKRPLPGWTLSWLRQAAPFIMTGELSEIALRHAVRGKVFPEAQPSVLKAVELLSRFVEDHKWAGKSLPASSYKLPDGSSVKVEAIGRYFSSKTKSDWLVAIQPRQHDIPNDEQFAMWRSVLRYEFDAADEDVMIVDLSKNSVSQKRELREITNRKFPALSKAELDERLDFIASCYLRAMEIVPERSRRPTREDDDPELPF